MTMTNGEIIKNYHVLQTVGQLRLPRKLSYAVGRNLETLNAELKSIGKEVEKIAGQYAKKDSDGEFVYESADGQLNYTFATAADKTGFDRECRILDGIETDVRIFTAPASVLEECERDTRFDLVPGALEYEIAWMLDY